MNANLPFALVYASLDSTWSREVIGKAIDTVNAATGRRLKLPDLIAAVKDECARMERAASAIRPTPKLLQRPGWEQEASARLMAKFASVRRSCEGTLPKWAKTHPDYVEGYQRQSCAHWGYDKGANQ